ncbi:exodeoxyribonuclease VII small subunit [Clostridium botulinum A2B7 92]|uniref:Exodeoxyribonuclease 7 small subunit n=2 Tax=Clostridium botulinum TaxID=1491 RepID=EX7S_CLOBM|nr:exodeoxyribonuclease VII small subunit [Clostridium botulinum]B1KT52.1 RecName: Full=Exodeoxyribonuclease 7 small subunit; AltName: Full=Exodeoxyribonuclease VII small subunit; Short=Exonuclease VII small subunit [Clostridium botulinum A3 str. Loch Maree]ACA54130.1 exodeoxyribonuclease VII, small subunit [Clostridium botulinum A3 str. Loch Maree]KEJ01144.1 exodeoxyribonuclease VII small subunit [Clostridium botulinum A2B7 92]NFH66294.1 exodeoxyribonuclease VII small subunit [Clostridium botu
MGRKKESFENMLEKLETIVNSMDNGEITLEDSMKSYEEGIKLCNKLYKVLKDAEGKIKILEDNKEEDFENS